MRYLKPYKLFESSTGDIDMYLEKMGATRDDINDIFISLIDKGYRIETDEQGLACH